MGRLDGPTGTVQDARTLQTWILLDRCCHLEDSTVSGVEWLTTSTISHYNGAISH